MRRGGNQPLHNRSALLILSVAFGLSFKVHSCLLGFYVDAAGIVLAAASIAVITVRMVAGFACDRADVEPLRLCASMVLVGSLGVGLLRPRSPSSWGRHDRRAGR